MLKSQKEKMQENLNYSKLAHCFTFRGLRVIIFFPNHDTYGCFFAFRSFTFNMENIITEDFAKSKKKPHELSMVIKNDKKGERGVNKKKTSQPEFGL